MIEASPDPKMDYELTMSKVCRSKWMKIEENKNNDEQFICVFKQKTKRKEKKRKTIFGDGKWQKNENRPELRTIESS